MAARSQREKDHMKNKNQVILAEMLKEESNKYCSDCGAKGPRWASWNLGVFLCIRCAGIHRNLGVHISKVKSVNLDSWTPEQMANIQDWGNRRAGLYWECFLPKDFHRPQTNSAVETFIRNKYEHKKYVKKDGIPPKAASSATAPASDSKPEKVTKKKKDHDQALVIPKLHETAKKTTTTSVAPRPKPQPSASPAAAAPAPVKTNPPSMDLLSLDTPEPAVSQPVPQPAQQSTSLADELIDFGAFQTGPQTLSPTTTTTQQQPQPQQQQQLASVSQNTAPTSNEESLLKDDTVSTKSTKDSIMALFGTGGASSSHQQQMYGVPGGMYISPQQQPTPHNMINGPRMQTGMYHQQHHHHQAHQPHHQAHHQSHQRHMMPMHMQQQQPLMHHARPHQQHSQLSQLQNQMHNLKLHKNPQMSQAQQPNQFNMYNTNQTMFNQQAMSSLMTNQHMMNYQQQQPQFVSTGPVNNTFPINAMPSTGHTFNNQLWK